jgi:hypothetical protein
MREQTIQEEAGLSPDQWQPVDVSPIIPGVTSVGAPPPPPLSLGSHFVGSIPANIQHDATLVRTGLNTPNIPTFSLMPLGINASATNNSATQTIIRQGGSSSSSATIVTGSNIGGIDPRTTTTEKIGFTSEGKLVTLTNAGTITATLDSTVPVGFYVSVAVIGPGSGVLTPSTGLIDGNASLTLLSGQGTWLFFDGTDWEALLVGTVTSIALTVPPEFSVAGSPITTSGTLAITKLAQTAHLVYSGPSSGSPAVPTFRALVFADLPAGTGTVTSVGLTVPGFLTVGSPITTSGNIAVGLATEAANSVFSGPSSGGAAAPTFRALSAADIPGTLGTTQIGASGTPLTQISVYAFTFTPVAILANITAEQTFGAVGLTTADKVIVNGPTPTAGTGIVNARVSSAGVLALTFVNATSGTLTPTAGVYNVIAIRS